MSDQMVTVVGPHGRRIEVHKSTQEALPHAFPLPPTPKTPARKAASKRPSSKRTDTTSETASVPAAPVAPDSSAPVDETATVEPTKEAR